MKLGDLRLPGVIDSVGPIVDFVRATAERLSLTSKARHGLLLAADELVTNMIMHGYEENGLQGEVEVSAEADGEFLVLTLVDFAPPFDPSGRSAPDSITKPMEERVPGGLGLHLAMKQLDDFHYERRDGSNVNRLRVRVPQKTS